MIKLLLLRENIVLGFTVIFKDMHMDGFMVIGIEHESESKEDKNSRHFPYLYNSIAAKIVI